MTSASFGSLLEGLLSRFSLFLLVVAGFTRTTLDPLFVSQFANSTNNALWVPCQSWNDNYVDASFSQNIERKKLNGDLSFSPDGSFIIGKRMKITLFTFILRYGKFISTDIEIMTISKGEITMIEDNAEARQAVKVYKALGEPTRLKIALLLNEERNLCCSDIGSKLESVAGSTLSHHLKQLTDCGLLDLRKDGTYIYYSVNREIAQKYAPYLLE